MLAEHRIDIERTANILGRIDGADFDMRTLVGGVNLLQISAGRGKNLAPGHRKACDAATEIVNAASDLLLVAFAYGFYFAVFAVPALRRPLTLDVSDPATVTFGVVAGLVAMAAVEATWWITARIRGERPTVWENRRADGLTRPPSPTVHGVA